MNHSASLELSTQLLVTEARRRGVQVEILDAGDNFLRLRRDGHTEFVKQATRTSRDPYIAALIMENKEVTKQVLREAGLPVPSGRAVRTVSEADALLGGFDGAGLVVKPRSTNFGDGVTIFKTPGWPHAAALAAVGRALELDPVVLLERYEIGREFRFLVIGGETVAALHRVPANVPGDGARTIRELVAEKNRDPRRGHGYVTPLERLRLGDEEREFLAAQGLVFDSVPAAGATIYLRENSNISTGGDSLDFTDTVHPGYKAAAVRAARSVGAEICGADLIIRAIRSAPTAQNFSIIELNFNPALHIHDFPFRGENRHVEARVLDLLGFPDPAAPPASVDQARVAGRACRPLSAPRAESRVSASAADDQGAVPPPSDPVRAAPAGQPETDRIRQ